MHQAKTFSKIALKIKRQFMTKFSLAPSQEIIYLPVFFVIKQINQDHNFYYNAYLNTFFQKKVSLQTIKQVLNKLVTEKRLVKAYQWRRKYQIKRVSF